MFALAWNGFVFPVVYFQWDKLIGTFQKEPVFFVFALFPLIGVFALYSTLTELNNWFRFGEAPLTLNASSVYIGGMTSFMLNGFADIKIKKGGSSSSGDESSTVWYQLKIIDSNGLETSGGDNLSGISFAKQIRQEMIDGLGHGWQPSGVIAKPGKLEKIKGFRTSSYSSWLQKLIPLLITLGVAYDLYNKFSPD